jgi:CDP-glycerol glycerophosphotransferase
MEINKKVLAMNDEQRYIQKRIWKASFQSLLFYVFRIFPVKKKKIVICCIEGTTGYSCNPKYIAEELIRRNEGYEIVWLVNDINKTFPKEISAVKNTLWNRAYHLSTACFWIDNSRKQLEVRKRKGQTYIQTWHAKLGFKPTCLDRGSSFSKIAYLVSKHDSDMIDYWLSNSDWYDRTLPTGSLYDGKTIRSGSPRCDILVNNILKSQVKVRRQYNLPSKVKILMYAPTFRGGSQGIDRTISASQGFPDYKRLKHSLETRFGGEWYIFLRLHPQLVARNLDISMNNTSIVDVSRADDMYEILAGCDAFITDYSSAAFDAAVMRIPIFLYADDYAEYEGERGKLLWDLRKLPFPLALTNDELEKQILDFNETSYQENLEQLFQDTGMVEDGHAAKRVVDEIEKIK